MTDALKAMVEAMAAAAAVSFESRPNSVDLLEDGRTLLVCIDNDTLAIDLEKVARAGLEAIKDQGDVYRPELTVAFAGMIAAILKDGP